MITILANHDDSWSIWWWYDEKSWQCFFLVTVRFPSRSLCYATTLHPQNLNSSNSKSNSRHFLSQPTPSLFPLLSRRGVTGRKLVISDLRKKYRKIFCIGAQQPRLFQTPSEIILIIVIFFRLILGGSDEEALGWLEDPMTCELSLRFLSVVIFHLTSEISSSIFAIRVPSIGSFSISRHSIVDFDFVSARFCSISSSVVTVCGIFLHCEENLQNVKWFFDSVCVICKFFEFFWDPADVSRCFLFFV